MKDLYLRRKVMSQSKIYPVKYYYKKNSIIEVLNIYVYLITSFLFLILLSNEHFNTNSFYVLVILSTVMFAWFAEISKSNLSSNFNIFISFSILFFLYGFRNYSAIDDPTYRKI